jgi:hypothetical protein
MPGLVPPNDRLKAGIEKVVRAVFGPRIDYLALYAAVVKAQGADGSLDLLPDDPKVPGLQGVPIDYGVPGVTATVAVGARVLLGFVGGDPSKPRATLWESASVTSLTLTASAIKLGGSGAAQALVLGTQYATHMTALSTALTALNAAITPLMLPPAAAAAKAALQLAITAANNLAGDISAQNTTL